MAPVVEKLAGEYGEKVKFVKLDVDSNPSITAQYNVSTIPTFIVFKNGERQESFTGLVPKDILASAINKSIK
jgi:thioredoxin 1